MFALLLGLGGFGSLLGSAGRIIGSVFEAVTPLIKGFFSLMVWYVQQLWEGFKDMIDNVASIIFVGSLIAGTALYVNHYQKCTVVQPTKTITKTITKQPDFFNDWFRF